MYSTGTFQASRFGQVGQSTAEAYPPCTPFKGNNCKKYFSCFFLFQTPSAPSIPSPPASVGAKKELGRRESESEEKKKREKQEEENRSSSKRSDSQLSRNPSDSSSSKNASTASVHSTNLGKPAPNLSFVARPEKPTVAEEKGRGSKEEEKKAEGGGGSSIGWSSEVLRGRASGAERVESTNAEFTNGTEAKESQEVTFHSRDFPLLHFYIPIIGKGG